MEFSQSFVVSAVLVLLTLCVFVRKTRIFSKKRYPPGPWGFPIIGHLPFLGGKTEKTFIKWWEQYGDVFSFRLGSWNAVMINGYDAIKDAADRSDDVFSDRPQLVFNKVINDEAFEGKKLISFLSFCPKYLHLKKITSRAIKNYMLKCDYPHETLFRDEAVRLADKLIGHGNDHHVEMIPYIEHSAESIVYQMFYGKGKEEEIEMNVKEIVDAVAYVNKFLSVENLVDALPWLRFVKRGKIEEFKKAVRATDRLTESIAEEHKATYEQGETRDFVDALLALSNEMPEEENDVSFPRSYLLHQRVAFQVGALDPISRTMLYIILYLTKHPDVQDRVQKEVDDVIGNDKAVRYKDRDDLPYLHAVILEVMRITSIVPTGMLRSAHHDTKFRGYDIDKDTLVFFNLHSVAHEKSFWGDPECFRPDRLLNEHGYLDNEKMFHIQYFGIGRRKCMGEMIARTHVFITTATLMQRCSFKKAEGCDLDTDPIRSIVLSPKPFKIFVQSR